MRGKQYNRQHKPTGVWYKRGQLNRHRRQLRSLLLSYSTDRGYWSAVTLLVAHFHAGVGYDFFDLVNNAATAYGVRIPRNLRKFLRQ